MEQQGCQVWLQIGKPCKCQSLPLSSTKVVGFFFSLWFNFLRFSSLHLEKDIIIKVSLYIIVNLKSNSIWKTWNLKNFNKTLNSSFQIMNDNMTQILRKYTDKDWLIFPNRKFEWLLCVFACTFLILTLQFVLTLMLFFLILLLKSLCLFHEDLWICDWSFSEIFVLYRLCLDSQGLGTCFIFMILFLNQIFFTETLFTTFISWKFSQIHDILTDSRIRNFQFRVMHPSQYNIAC